MKDNIGKNLVKAGVNAAFAGIGIRVLNESDLPQPAKALGNITIGAGLIKDTGKKLKVL